jgi:hypothetical protein
LKELLLKNE